jgi:hypothetical protein
MWYNPAHTGTEKKLMFIYDETRHEGWIHAARSNKFIVRVEYYPNREKYARAIITPRNSKSTDYLKTFNVWLEPTVGHFFSNPKTSFNHRVARNVSVTRALAQYYLFELHEQYYERVDKFGTTTTHSWAAFDLIKPSQIPYRHFVVPSLLRVIDDMLITPLLTEWWINPLGERDSTDDTFCF